MTFPSLPLRLLLLKPSRKLCWFGNRSGTMRSGLSNAHGRRTAVLLQKPAKLWLRLSLSPTLNLLRPTKVAAALPVQPWSASPCPGP